LTSAGGGVAAEGSFAASPLARIIIGANAPSLSSLRGRYASTLAPAEVSKEASSSVSSLTAEGTLKKRVSRKKASAQDLESEASTAGVAAAAAATSSPSSPSKRRSPKSKTLLKKRPVPAFAPSDTSDPLLTEIERLSGQGDYLEAVKVFKRAANDFAFTPAVSVLDDDDDDDDEGGEEAGSKKPKRKAAVSVARPVPPSLAAASAARDAAVIVSAQAPLPRPAALPSFESDNSGEGGGGGGRERRWQINGGGGNGNGDGEGSEPEPAWVRQRRERQALRSHRELRREEQERFVAQQRSAGVRGEKRRPPKKKDSGGEKGGGGEEQPLPSSFFFNLDPELETPPDSLFAATWAAARGPPPMPGAVSFEGLYPALALSSGALRANASIGGIGSSSSGNSSFSPPALFHHHHHHLVLPPLSRAASKAMLARAAECGSGAVGGGALSSFSPPLAPNSERPNSSWRGNGGGNGGNGGRRPRSLSGFSLLREPSPLAAAAAAQLHLEARLSGQRLTVEELWLAVAATARFVPSSSLSSSSLPSPLSSSAESEESADASSDSENTLLSAPFPAAFSFDALLAEAERKDAHLRWQWRDHLSRGAAAVLLAERPRETLVRISEGGENGNEEQELFVTGTAAAARLMRVSQGRVPPWALARCLCSAAERGDLEGVAELLEVALAKPNEEGKASKLSLSSSTSVAARALQHASQQTAEALLSVLDACADASASASADASADASASEAAPLARRAWRFLEACVRAREASSSSSSSSSSSISSSSVSSSSVPSSSAASDSSEGLESDSEGFAPPPELGFGGDEANKDDDEEEAPRLSSPSPPLSSRLSSSAPALFFSKALDDPDVSHPLGRRAASPPASAYHSLAATLARAGDVRGALAAVAALEAAHGNENDNGNGNENDDEPEFLPRAVSPRHLSLRTSVALDPHRGGLRDAARALSRSVEAIDEAYYLLEDAVVEWKKAVEERRESSPDSSFDDGDFDADGGTFASSSSSSPVPRAVADLVLEACALRGDSERALETFDAYEGVLGLEPGAAAYCSAASALLSAGAKEVEREMGGIEEGELERENDDENDDEDNKDEDDLLRDSRSRGHRRRRGGGFRPPNRNAAAVAAVAAEASEKGLASPRLARIAFTAGLEGRDALAAARALRLYARTLGELRQRQLQRELSKSSSVGGGKKNKKTKKSEVDKQRAVFSSEETEGAGAALVPRSLPERLRRASQAWRDGEALAELEALEGLLAASGGGGRQQRQRQQQWGRRQQQPKEQQERRTREGAGAGAGGEAFSPASSAAETLSHSPSSSSSAKRGSSGARGGGGGRSASDEEEFAA